MQYSIIKKSQLEGACRLDAEYYQPEYLGVDKKIEEHDFKTIHDLGIKVFSGPFGSTLKSESYQSEGVPFIRISNISDILIQKDKDLVFISPEEHKRIYGTHLKSGDIVFSKIGTVGRLSVIPDEFGEVNISENNIGLRSTELPPNDRIHLLIFLLSKYGQSQIIRKASGNIQLKLNVTDIESVKIPQVSKFEKEKLTDIYDEILGLREKSESLYSQAEQILLEELGLQDFESDDALYNVVKLSETQESERIDAEYFERKYERLEKKLQENKAQKLGDLVSVKKGVEPGSEAYQEEGKLFIRVSSISKDGVNEQDQKYLSDDLYNELKENYKPKSGEILLTKDATPGIAYVLKENIEGIISGGILRLKLKSDIDAEYLALCINSLIGQLQAQRDAGGSIIKHWKPDQIKQVLIPILSKPTQQKIADLVRKSHEARNKAKELLEQAKHTVERLIEEGK